MCLQQSASLQSSFNFTYLRLTFILKGLGS